MPNRPPHHPQRPKVKPGIDPQMATHVERADSIVRIAVMAVGLMQAGELPHVHARELVHQLNSSIKQCHDFAHRPDWQHGRDTFLELADTMAETRDDVRDLIGDTDLPLPETPSDDFNVVEYLANCQEGLRQGLAMLDRVRVGTSPHELVQRFISVMQPEIGNALMLALLPDLAASNDALMQLSVDARDAVAQARALL